MVAASASRSRAARPVSPRAASSTAARRRCGTSASCSACSGTGAPPRWRSRHRDRCSRRTRWRIRRTGLTQGLNAIPAYRALFAEAYAREPARDITLDEIERALAAFESSLVSFSSRYDRYAFGDATALTPLELDGHNVFRGFVARCSQCHVPPLFTDGELAVVGAPAVAGRPYDTGAGRQSDDPALVGAFRTPTLRNVALTAPYFNAGQFATLHDVVTFYNDTRGHALPKSVPQQVHWHIAMKAPMLSEADVTALVAFLSTLTDESLKPRVPEPCRPGCRSRPTHRPLPSRRRAPRVASQPVSKTSAEEACPTCPH